MKNKIILLFILVLVVSGFIFAQEDLSSPEQELETFSGKIKDELNIAREIEVQNVYLVESKKMLVFPNQENQEQGSVKIGNDVYMNVKENKEGGSSFIELDKDGNIKYADLTASKDTSFVFDGRTHVLPADTRIIYENGVVRISGKKNTGFTIREGSESYDLNFKESDIPIEIGKIGGKTTLSGKGFFYDGLIVDGSIRLLDKGPLIISKSTVNLLDKGLVVRAFDSDVLLANSDTDLSSYQGSYVFPGDSLVLKGRVRADFKKGNPWLGVTKDTQNVFFDLLENPKMTIIPRKDQDLAPLVDLKLENGKINMFNGAIKVSFSKEEDRIFDILALEEAGVPMEVKSSLNNYYAGLDLLLNELIEFTPTTYTLYLKDPRDWEYDYNPDTGESRESGTLYERNFKLYMGVDGNIKYPLTTGFYKSPFSLSRLDPNRYYIDEGVLGFLKEGLTFETSIPILYPQITNNIEAFKKYPNFPFYSSAAEFLLKNYPERREEFLEIIANSPEPAVLGIGQRDSAFDHLRSTYMVKDFGEIMRVLKDYPDTQKAFVDNINIEVVDRSSDLNIISNMMLYSDRDLFNDFLDNYGQRQYVYDSELQTTIKIDSLTLEEIEDLSIAKDLYDTFDLAFPKYANVGLKDSNKLAFVMAGVQNYADLGLEPIKAVANSLEVFFERKQKNPVLFDKNYDLHIYSFAREGGFIPGEPDFGKTEEIIASGFDNVISKNIEKNGRSLKKEIIMDLSNPDIQTSVFAFNNHGTPNFQALGSVRSAILPFKNKQMIISDDDMANALFKRYIASADNPSERTFGNNVIFIQSCFSGDYVENVQSKLRNRLSRINVDSSQVQFPTIISLTDKGSSGRASGIAPNLKQKMQDGDITLQDFLDIQGEKIEEGLDFPTIWFNQVDNIDNCQIYDGRYCRAF